MLTISLTTLKRMEADEYATLKDLIDLKHEYENEGNHKLAESIKRSEEFQRGRWSMMVDIIDKLELVNEE